MITYFPVLAPNSVFMCLFEEDVKSLYKVISEYSLTIDELEESIILNKQNDKLDSILEEGSLNKVFNSIFCMFKINHTLFNSMRQIIGLQVTDSLGSSLNSYKQKDYKVYFKEYDGIQNQSKYSYTDRDGSIVYDEPLELNSSISKDTVYKIIEET